ncbi:MAG: tyrosine-type recombinase/integrase [Pyramidobacter sp.]|nr:tyrosine-type recombinase/integrase [Pyramidobacter sp.]
MLTEKLIRAAQPKEKKYLVCDTDHLYLVIYPSGLKTWVFRQQTGGKPFKKTLGAWPEMSLYDARTARNMIMQTMPARGQSVPTFAVLAEEWLNDVYTAKVTPKSVLRQRSRLARYINPALGNLYPRDITADKVLDLLRGVERQGFLDLSHDLLQLIAVVLRYGRSRGFSSANISDDLRGALRPARNQHHAALTRREDVAGFLRAVATLPESSVKRCLMFTMYTLARSGEARKAVWSEIDITRSVWELPAERMKMRRPHIVPLSRQALDVLMQARLYDGGGEYVFPTPRSKKRPLSDMAMLAALRRLGYTSEEASVHGLRTMASTLLNEAGWRADAIERALAHVEGNEVRAAYNRAEHIEERRLMLQWYADFLDALRDGTPEPPKPQI